MTSSAGMRAGSRLRSSGPHGVVLHLPVQMAHSRDPAQTSAYRPRVQGSRQRKIMSMDDHHSDARECFFSAIRILACSADSIQSRLIAANESILRVAIDEFDGDAEMKIKFARILDLLAVDQDDIEIVAHETAAHMTDLQASAAAHLICDFYFDLGDEMPRP